MRGTCRRYLNKGMVKRSIFRFTVSLSRHNSLITEACWDALPLAALTEFGVCIFRFFPKAKGRRTRTYILTHKKVFSLSATFPPFNCIICESSIFLTVS